MTNNLNIKRIKSVIVVFISNAFQNYYQELLDETEDSDKSFEREVLIHEIATEMVDNSEYLEYDELIEWAERDFSNFIDSELNSEINFEKINIVVDNINYNFNELFDSALNELLEKDQGWLENIDSNDLKKIINEAKQEIKNLFKRENPLGE